MSRAKNKTELIDFSRVKFQEIFSIINSLSVDKQTMNFFSTDLRDKNFRDVLIHLYEWQMLFISFVEANVKGISTPFLPAPYNFRNYPQMNLAFWQKHQTTTLEQAKTLLHSTHNKILNIIENFTDNELFSKKYFNWTGSTSLGSYAVSALSSHYDWALKLIKKQVRLLKKYEKNDQ